MADYAPPPGPPPPKVPAGWRAVWNDQYKEWFYVNIYTKKSQWDKPTEAVYESGDQAPEGGPPIYDHSTARATTDSKNPFLSGGSGGISEDERLARQLQDEEDARARGAADSYYAGGQNSSSSSSTPYAQQQLPQRDATPQKRGLFSKVFGSSSSNKHGGGRYGHSPGPQYGGYPPHQQAYYGGGYGGYPPQGGYYGQPQRQGLGAGGGAALGLGAGLLGGALIGEAIADDGGGDGGDGGDYGGDGGGDGGGDF